MDLVKNVVSEIRSIRRLLGLTKAKCPCKYRIRLRLSRCLFCTVFPFGNHSPFEVKSDKSHCCHYAHLLRSYLGIYCILMVTKDKRVNVH